MFRLLQMPVGELSLKQAIACCTCAFTSNKLPFCKASKQRQTAHSQRLNFLNGQLDYILNIQGEGFPTYIFYLHTHTIIFPFNINICLISFYDPDGSFHFWGITQNLDPIYDVLVQLLEYDAFIRIDFRHVIFYQLCSDCIRCQLHSSLSKWPFRGGPAMMPQLYGITVEFNNQI